jgi:Tfp pilus assembly protein PilN
MKRIGIDVGPAEVRVARAEHRFGASRITGLARLPYATPAGLAEALARAIPADRAIHVAIAVPLASAAHRLFELPFSDGRRLAETVPLELVGQLPADPGEVAIGFEVVTRSSRCSTILAAAVRRDDLAAARAPLAAAGRAADEVALAPAPVWSLLDRSAVHDVALVLAEHGRSTVSVRRAGHVVLVRALTGSPGDGAAFANEVRWAIAVAGGSVPIVIAGPDATDALAASLAAALGEPARRLAEVVPSYGPDLDGCALAAGLALGPRLVLDGTRTQADVRRRRRVVALAAAAALLAVVDVGIVRMGIARRETLLADAIRATAAAALPPGTRIVAPRAQLEAAAGDAARDGVRPQAILALLRDLGTRIPTGVHLDLDELVVDGDVLRLHGRASGFDDVDLVRRTLAAAPALRDVAAEDARAAVDGRGVEFGLRATWHATTGAPS